MTSVPNHPIRLETLFFTQCCVTAVPGYEAPNDKLLSTPENAIEVRKDPQRPGGWVGVMKTAVNPGGEKKGPYQIEVTCLAHLTADESLNEDEAARGVLITAHSVLYGAIRENIAWLTARQPYGPIVLGLSVLKSSEAAVDKLKE